MDQLSLFTEFEATRAEREAAVRGALQNAGQPMREIQLMALICRELADAEGSAFPPSIEDLAIATARSPATVKRRLAVLGELGIVVTSRDEGKSANEPARRSIDWDRTARLARRQAGPEWGMGNGERGTGDKRDEFHSRSDDENALPAGISVARHGAGGISAHGRQRTDGDEGRSGAEVLRVANVGRESGSVDVRDVRSGAADRHEQVVTARRSLAHGEPTGGPLGQGEPTGLIAEPTRADGDVLSWDIYPPTPLNAIDGDGRRAAAGEDFSNRGRRQAAGRGAWAEVERLLAECEVGDLRISRKARRHGVAPADVLRLVEHWRKRPGAWGVGALHRRIENQRPGLAIEAGWPKPSEQAERADLRKAREATSDAERRKFDADRRQADEDARRLEFLEAEHGGAIDGAGDDELAAVLQQAGEVRTLAQCRRTANFGRGSPLLRGVMLEAWAASVQGSGFGVRGS